MIVCRMCKREMVSIKGYHVCTACDMYTTPSIPGWKRLLPKGWR